MISLTLRPSATARNLVVALHLLLLAPASMLLSAGWQWLLFLASLLVSLYQSWSLGQTPITLELRGSRLRWPDGEGEISRNSRVLPGLIWLRLTPKGSWLIFADRVSAIEFRALARLIRFELSR